MHVLQGQILVYGGHAVTMKPNPQQQAAIDSSARDLAVTAGAGSGKTRVLTERYSKAAERSGAGVLDSVVTITFTDKAAGEIAQRVRDRLSHDGHSAIAKRMDDAWISTIHGMCSRLLRRHALEAGIDPLFAVGNDVQLGVLKQRAFEHIAAESLDARGVAASLLAAYGFANVSEWIDAVSEQLRSLGATVDDVVRETVSAEDIVAYRVDLLRLADEYAGLSPQGKTISANATAVRELADAIGDFAAGDTGALELALLAAGVKQARTGGESLKLLAEEGLEIAANVALLAAQCAAEPLESAFLGLVQRYADEYATLKAQAQLLDFEDLQTKVIGLFEAHPDLRDRYERRFTQVMVDEFQDTNVMQVRLIRAIAPAGFISVGDEKQSIYRFRHADVDLFRQKSARSSCVLPLSVNYRSHPELLTFFNDLFSREPFWPQDFLALEAGRGAATGTGDRERFGPARVTALIIDTNACGKDKHADEATTLAEHIQGLVDRGVPQRDIVMLMRTMRHADTYAGALRERGIEAFVASGGTYFDRPEVLDLEMLLRSIANPLDDEAFVHVLAGPLAGLSAQGLGRIRLAAGRGCLWDAATNEAVEGLGDSDREALKRVLGALEWARSHAGRIGLADLIHDTCERLEYDLTLFSSGYQGARAWANVLKLARIAEQFEDEDPGDPQAFLEYLRLKREYEGRESLAAFAVEGVDAVRIMSVHAAKGLQFPVTVAATLGHAYSPSPAVMLGVRDGRPVLGLRVPHPDGGRALDTSGHRQVAETERAADLEESKRVFYVACTRAEEALVLCGRTDLSKPAESDRPIGWLRQAFGIAAGCETGSGVHVIGDATVDVRFPVPPACELPDAIQPDVDGAVLSLACAVESDPLPSGSDPLERISYSGLALHRACPYRFYATSIARLGSPVPARDRAESPTAFGTAVHAALFLAGDTGMPDEVRMREICRSAGVAEDRTSEVAAVCRTFLGSKTAEVIASAERVLREMPFAVPIAGVLLDGVIDLIALEGPRALIVDYKTGKPHEQHDPTERYRAQAACYAVAADQMGAREVSVEFHQLECGGSVTRFDFSPDEIAIARIGIERQLDQIGRGEFEHLDRYDALVCRECPALGGLCPINPPAARSSG